MKKPNQAEPDVLAMTATPIPRTLALSLYGDLDLSVIDELPPGRTPIVTRRIPEEKADEVWQFVRAQVAEGRQAYVVYPVIEGSKDDQPELDFAAAEEDEETTAPSTSLRSARDDKSRGNTQRQASVKTAAKSAPKAAKPAAKSASRAKKPSLFPKTPLRSATEMYDSLRTGALAGLRLGLLHGRLSADDKDVTMKRFQQGEIDVLISTTVIEVGVDVPNASVMVVEHAERFGLAQLHQLRGRVGRGAAKSYCLLVESGRVSPQGEQRLAAMEHTQDGFELAEMDLQLRGPGEFFGTRQAGLPDFRVANLLRDRELLEAAKAEAAQFVKTPEGTEQERALVRRRLQDTWQRRYGLSEA